MSIVKLAEVRNSWVSTSARAGLGPAPLHIRPPFFLLGTRIEPQEYAYTIGL